MKKLTTALAVAVFAATMPAFAWEASVYKTNTVDDAEFVTTWHFSISDSLQLPRTATLMWVDGAVGDVKIPDVLSADGVVWNVTKVADRAFANNTGLLSVEVPNAILEIGSYVFENCTALSKVTLNYGIRYIGERAFMNTIIKEIELPDSLLDMGGNIAAGSLFTESITIGDSSHFVYSKDGVLYNRDKTKLFACPTRAEGTVTIPDSVTQIATDAFFGCHRLSYLNLPATVETIGEGAFNVAGIWPGLKAPESEPKLLSIFYNGPVPNAADDIYAGAPAGLVSYALDKDWNGMSTWKGREVKPIDGTNPPTLSYTDATGITWFYRIANSEVEIYNEDASGNPITAVSPASTSGIAYKESEESTTFRKALKIPEAINGFAVTKIGPHAFDGCAALSCLGIPASVREIGDFAFNGCTAISSIGAADDVPFSVAANTITLPTGVSKLGYHPFDGLKVSSVSLPFTLSEIDGNPVAGCAYVTMLSVDSTCPSFLSEGNVLYNKKKDTIIAVPANYDGASLSFPDSVTTIGDEALLGCKNVTTVQMPVALETIGESALDGCESIKALTMPASLAEIGSGAFANCSSLEKVTYMGDAPDAARDIYDGTPESLVSYISADAEGFTDDTWKDRKISKDDPNPDLPEPGEYTDSDGTTWTYDIKGKSAVVTTMATDAKTVTIPATLAGLPIAEIDPEILNSLSGVKAYRSESSLYKAKNGCLYSADGKTLIRVPDAMVLPYSVTTEVSSNVLTVTVIPGIKDSGNPGNDGTIITTNITGNASSSKTQSFDGDISAADLFNGVTAIADYAFYGCNNFSNSYENVTEDLGGETGFIGSDAYVRTKTRESSQSIEYTTTLLIPATVTSIGDNAFAESGVTATRTSQSSHRQTTSNSTPASANDVDAANLTESTSYIGWIMKNGTVVGTATAKTAKKRNGVLNLTGSALFVGQRKVQVKSIDSFNELGDVLLVKDLSKSKVAADKAAFDGFKGKCWTIALETSGPSALLGGYTTLSLNVKARGKVSVQGTAADGTKISASAQMVRDGDSFKIPVAVQLYTGKRGGFAAVFVVSNDGKLSVDGGKIDFTAIKNGSANRTTLVPVAVAPRGDSLSGDLLLWGVSNAGYSLADNTGWRPRYTKSTGRFKGSVNLVRKSDGRRVRATVTGAVVDGVGYGTAVIKGVGSWEAEVR